jgi:hypothetical protein
MTQPMAQSMAQTEFRDTILAHPDGSPSREEVEAAVCQAMVSMGPAGFDKANLARPFMARGMARSTIYRWIREILATGRPGAAIEAEIVEAAKERAEAARHPAKSAAKATATAMEIVGLIPPTATLGDLTGDDGTIAVVARIAAILRDMDLLVQHAKHEDGRIKNSKLLLAASREMRQSLETAVKLREALRQERDLDEMMRAIVSEVAQESPACAQRIFRRMSGVLTLHGF